MDREKTLINYIVATDACTSGVCDDMYHYCNEYCADYCPGAGPNEECVELWLKEMEDGNIPNRFA